MRSQPATDILARGVSALAAVECTIGLLEQSGLFNAGRGANRQLDGVQRMDAAIMEGAHLEAGAVASIEGIVHPITAARLVMEKTDHVLLVGPFAGRFARYFNLDRASFRRRASPSLLRPDSRKTETFNNRAAWDRRRCRLGSLRDGGGRGFDRGYRFDVAGAGRRQPAHWLWSLRG